MNNSPNDGELVPAHQQSTSTARKQVDGRYWDHSLLKSPCSHQYKNWQQQMKLAGDKFKVNKRRLFLHTVCLSWGIPYHRTEPNLKVCTCSKKEWKRLQKKNSNTSHFCGSGEPSERVSLILIHLACPSLS